MSRGRRHVVAALAVTVSVSACVPTGHLGREQAAAPIFDPIRFFSGHTDGRGNLKVILRHSESTLVAGTGVVGPRRSIVLDQDVRQGDAAPKHRTWRLREVGAGSYTGTLTDAVGPVSGEVKGNLLHLRFAMKGGLRAQQWLYLQSGGQIAHNRMIVTKFGLPVASLDETITREPS